ncbi:MULTISPECIES: TetR/AcrR family transcriptional regulator [Clostridium]|uniref:TetR/AcrR family transcriptional regulator n=1 Tax=Candidatus Clostridium helianthi TaxID=3381660 RepID=A0ABW8S653_9CLOT|nr:MULTISPECIES: TetR/AcrR family transcriptional regulator [Clostridium]MBN7573410.1 TetR/AcrR family transcriptional regulator [Clostridium beijerinckii]MBN7578748.1 TetR/AcrR family transcriptional regulator [Clostridium beijerinckii]MBN7583183.1 TetR/AcrR family transcriptional regulator [Clostridium beijerinckii]MBO0519338.1 TetR/AcrR family transcriptional regulator [Clostridium beijerinckii]MZK49135.1 TetR family transcriptional regulator [Clostridium beijerinckii]
MVNKSTNIQNMITKESIFTSLMILMEKKNFKEISITEITKKAGVSRMAFYRNYNIKEDIITTYLDELFNEYSKEVMQKETLYNYENLRLYFSYFRKHEKLISNLINSSLTNILLEKCIESFYELSQTIFCKNSLLPEKHKFWIEYMAGGLYNVLIEWAKNGMKQSDDYMATTVSEFINK